MKYHASMTAALLSAITLVSCGKSQVSENSISSDLRELAGGAGVIAAPSARTAVYSGKFKPDLARAVSAAPDYRAAQSAVDEAVSGVEVARSLRRPQVEMNGNIGALKEVGPTRTTTTEGASATLYLRQVVYDGGESDANIGKAVATQLGAQARAMTEGNRIAREAGDAWIDLWQYEQRRQLLTERAQKARDILGQMQQLIASGVIDKSATTSAEIAMRNLELEKVNLNASHAEAQALFSIYFGKTPKSVNRPDLSFSQDEFARVAKDWASVPALQAAAARTIIARQDFEAAEARKKPTAGFRTGVNSPMSDTSSTDYVVGLEVRWILGDGGRRKADSEAKAARLEAEKSALAALKLRSKAELESALAKRAALATSLETLREQEQAATEESSILWSQLATGQTSMRQLVDAEINAYRSSDRLIAATAEAMKLDLEMGAQSGLLLRKLGMATQTEGAAK